MFWKRNHPTWKMPTQTNKTQYLCCKLNLQLAFFDMVRNVSLRHFLWLPSIYVSSLTNICCKNDKFLEPGQVFKEKSPHLLTAAIPAAKLALRETLIRPWFVFLFAPFVQHIVCLIPICTAQFTLYSPNFHTYNPKVEWGGGGVIYIQWKIRQRTFQSRQ